MKIVELKALSERGDYTCKYFLVPKAILANTVL